MSFQIKKFKFSNETIVLSKPNSFHNNHTFTILTGRNGIGKSRLLVSLISNLLSDDLYDEELDKYNLNKIIAVSNIKNDKFPSTKRHSEKYFYIGNKSNFPTSYNDRFSVFKNILINKNLNNFNASNALNYLGFESIIIYDFSKPPMMQSEMTRRYSNYIECYEKYFNLFNSDILPSSFRNKLNSLFKNILLDKNEKYNTLFEDDEIDLNPNDRLNFNQYNINSQYDKHINKQLNDFFKNKINEEELFFLDCVVKSDILLKKISYDHFHKLFTIVLENNILNYLKNFQYNIRSIHKTNLLTDISFLLEIDLLKIRNISLISLHNNNEIRFFNLSSGEQSLFNILLGISSVIENNSLICIDEPEVNLHPEWQNEFIIKLQNIFDHITGCHFIIATHSPQIVSGLMSKNGFIVDMENNITYNIEDYSKKSSDYQLAHLFGYPGYNNEYLIRIALTLLSKITNQNKLDANDNKNLVLLNSFKNDLPENDPVNFLIDQINSLVI
ncbi:AAA family ATPase [Acinetobacter bereziniae]|uniref:AAA family ATPase n=1 Tax=Acinetobacter bereziniae TaxID=106648 RepID=UPI003AF5FCA0